MSPQLPLTLKFLPDQCLAEFIGQPELRTLVDAVASGKSTDWLYFSGAAGSGKTHLLLAACAQAHSYGRQAVYLPLATMVGQLASVLDGQEHADLICLDGLEAVAGNHDDEIALFHFYNRARSTCTHVMYAATVMPGALSVHLPDLTSRLEQCTRWSLALLDEQGRRAVLRQRALRRGLELEDTVIDYLFRRINRDLGTLTDFLDRLDRESLVAQRRITIPFLRGVLGRV